jgi:hypothetical protein
MGGLSKEKAPKKAEKVKIDITEKHCERCSLIILCLIA